MTAEPLPFELEISEVGGVRLVLRSAWSEQVAAVATRDVVSCVGPSCGVPPRTLQTIGQTTWGVGISGTGPHALSCSSGLFVYYEGAFGTPLGGEMTFNGYSSFTGNQGYWFNTSNMACLGWVESFNSLHQAVWSRVIIHVPPATFFLYESSNTAVPQFVFGSGAYLFLRTLAATGADLDPQIKAGRINY